MNLTKPESRTEAGASPEGAVGPMLIVWRDVSRGRRYHAYTRDGRMIGVVESASCYSEDWSAALAWDRPHKPLGVYWTEERARKAVVEAAARLLESQGSEAAGDDTAALPAVAEEQTEGACPWCAVGNPRVESSVNPGRGIYVHTRTEIGRVVCRAKRRVGD